MAFLEYDVFNVGNFFTHFILLSGTERTVFFQVLLCLIFVPVRGILLEILLELLDFIFTPCYA